MSLPYSQACENNKQPILERIAPLLAEATHVLEIGSGTGQHGVWFSRALPHLVWQTSDRQAGIDGLTARIRAEGPPNLRLPVVLDVAMPDWPLSQAGNIFTANSLHIMSKKHVESFFGGSGKILEAGGQLFVYGPFKYEGQFTTPSNARFDLWLKQRDPLSGVRDIEWINRLAKEAGCRLLYDYAMPANNQLLVFEKNCKTEG